MAPKHHPMPLSGGDRKALTKELARARAMTTLLATRSSEKRTAGEALIREADDLLCQSWNEKMWAAGGPIDPSPSIDQAINAGYPWLEIRCSRCKAPRAVDLGALRYVPSTMVHDLAGRLRCVKCARQKASGRAAAVVATLPNRRRAMTDATAEAARLMKVAEAIVHEMEHQGIADAVADLGFDVMEMARVVIRAADGDVVPFRKP